MEKRMSKDGVDNGILRDPGVSEDQTSAADLTPESTDAVANGRSRSCLLCRKRKIKCDRRTPSCSTCLKAGANCVQPKNYVPKASEKDPYTLHLEKKIEYMERILDREELKNDPDVQRYKLYLDHPGDFDEDEESQAKRTQLAQPNLPQALRKVLDSDGTPSYETHYTDMVRYLLAAEPGLYSSCIYSKYDLSEFLTLEPVLYLDRKLTKTLLDVFILQIEPIFPIMYQKDCVEYSSAIYQSFSHGYVTNHFHLSWCIFSLVSAICAGQLIAMGVNYKGPVPGIFFSTAIRHSMKLKEIDVFSQIQILFLSVLYLIGTNVDVLVPYEILEDTLRLCASIDLHKPVIYDLRNESLTDRSLRLFWCVYLLERTLANILHKPYAIPEYMIAPDLPLFGTSRAVTITPLQAFANHQIKLTRIESNFIEELGLFKPSNNNDILSGIDASKKEAQIPMVRNYLQQLAQWKQESEKFSNLYQLEVLSMSYCKGVRVLLEPYLEFLDPSDEIFIEGQKSAGELCLFSRTVMYRTLYGHSNISIQTVFDAGIILIYSLWLERKSYKNKIVDTIEKDQFQRNISMLDRLTSCSVYLNILAERSNLAKVLRDIFERLHRNVFDMFLDRDLGDSGLSDVLEIMSNSNVMFHNSNIQHMIAEIIGSSERDMKNANMASYTSTIDVLGDIQDIDKRFDSFEEMQWNLG